jgi:hypothetical protein
MRSVPSVVYDQNAAYQSTRANRENGAWWDYSYDALGPVSSAQKREPPLPSTA